MKKQQGLSFFGFIIIAVFVAAAAITFFKVIPAYTNYFSIKSAVVRAAKSGGSPAGVKEAFSKSSEIDYFTDVSADDLKVTQVGGVIQVSVDYEKVVPLVANISLLFSFSINESSGPSAGN